MDVALRQATVEDSRVIAELFILSSDGLASYIWSRMAQPGEDLLAVGERRYAREGVAFSYQNCTIAEAGGEIVGMVHAFPMERVPGAEPEADPVLRPYSELEDYGSLYVSGIAVFPEFRNRGIGARLLFAAEKRARSLGLPRVSLICFERNLGAMRLYERFGYRATARRAVVPHPMLHHRDGDAVLLARAVDE